MITHSCIPLRALGTCNVTWNTEMGNTDTPQFQFLFLSIPTSKTSNKNVIRDCGSNLYAGMRVVEMF